MWREEASMLQKYGLAYAEVALPGSGGLSGTRVSIGRIYGFSGCL